MKTYTVYQKLISLILIFSFLSFSLAGCGGGGGSSSSVSEASSDYSDDDSAETATVVYSTDEVRIPIDLLGVPALLKSQNITNYTSYSLDDFGSVDIENNEIVLQGYSYEVEGVPVESSSETQSFSTISAMTYALTIPTLDLQPKSVSSMPSCYEEGKGTSTGTLSDTTSVILVPGSDYAAHLIMYNDTGHECGVPEAGNIYDEKEEIPIIKKLLDPLDSTKCVDHINVIMCRYNPKYDNKTEENRYERIYNLHIAAKPTDVYENIKGETVFEFPAWQNKIEKDAEDLSLSHPLLKGYKFNSKIPVETRMSTLPPLPYAAIIKVKYKKDSDGEKLPDPTFSPSFAPSLNKDIADLINKITTPTTVIPTLWDQAQNLIKTGVAVIAAATSYLAWDTIKSVGTSVVRNIGIVIAVAISFDDGFTDEDINNTVLLVNDTINGEEYADLSGDTPVIVTINESVAFAPLSLLREDDTIVNDLVVKAIEANSDQSITGNDPPLITSLSVSSDVEKGQRVSIEGTISSTSTLENVRIIYDGDLTKSLYFEETEDGEYIITDSLLLDQVGTTRLTLEAISGSGTSYAYYDVTIIESDISGIEIESVSPESDVTLDYGQALSFIVDLISNDSTLSSGRWYLNHAVVEAPIFSGTEESSSYVFVGDAAGTYYLSFKGWDADGNSVTQEWTITVNPEEISLPIIDPEPLPIVIDPIEDSEPAEVTVIASPGVGPIDAVAGDQISLSISATTDEGDIESISYEKNGALISTYDSDSGYSSTLTKTITASVGTNTYTMVLNFTEREAQSYTWTIDIAEEEVEHDVDIIRYEGSKNSEIEVGERLHLEAYAECPAGDLEKIKWYVDGDLEDTDACSGETCIAKFNFSSDDEGKFTIKAKAYDEEDNAYSVYWYVTVVAANEPPELTMTSPSSTRNTVEQGDEINLVGFANDTDRNLDVIELSYKDVDGDTKYIGNIQCTTTYCSTLTFNRTSSYLTDERGTITVIITAWDRDGEYDRTYLYFTVE